MIALLRDQIEKHFGNLETVPQEFRGWIDEVESTYRRFERDQQSLERTLERTLKDLKAVRREQRVRAAETHAAEAEQLAVTLRSIGDGVITASSHGEVLLMNRVAEELTGWSHREAMGMPLETVLNVVDAPEGTGFPRRADEVSHETLDMSGILLCRDGSRRAISNRMSPMHGRDGRILGVVIVFRDVTEARRLEEERQKASKLESVGLLAGGIAHDFNNFLTAILGNVALARAQIPSDGKAAELLRLSEKAARRARDLTQQLLTFSRGGSPVKTTASAEEVVRESAKFALRGSNVRWELEIEGDLRAVEIDRGQVAQVLHNLIINADQAMPEGGVVRIRAANEHVGDGDRRPLTAGDYVAVQIEDGGAGIPEGHLDKVFDPYFTTKEKGSGLGLATSYSIARNHKGWIDVASRTGHGATFTVYLPAAPLGAAAEESSAQLRIDRQGGRVLVMDDDPMVRKVAEDMLQFLGYEVMVTEDGEEMISDYRAAMDGGRPFDIVITDLTIPGGMGGAEAIAQLLEIDPGARVIVSSGYSNDPIMADHTSFGFRAVLRKPFDVEELNRALTEVGAGV